MRLALLSLALLLGAAPALAAGCGTPQELRFAPGTSSATVAGAIVRGDRACYAFTARAGQRVEAQVTSVEDNAVFQLYAPGWRIARDGGADGGTLPGAGEGQDATRFTGPLPANGRYLVVLGGTRGNAEFTFRLSIH